MLNVQQLALCTSVPIHLKESVSFFVDKTKIPSEEDWNCDEMPWKVQKGKTVRKYCIVGKEQVWALPKGSSCDDKCDKIIKVVKCTYIHTRVQEARKTAFYIEGHHIVLLSYTGLRNQEGLELGRRHVRPSTAKLIQQEMQTTRSLKRVLFNVSKKVGSREMATPSATPTYRTVLNEKSKVKKKECDDVVTSVCHKMADEDVKFTRSYQVNSNVVSVICFDDKQLDDIERFCCHDEFPCSPLYVDTTFKFGSFFVVTTTYRNLYVKSKRTGKYPCIMGPVMITHRTNRQTYRLLFDSITQARPSLSTNLKAFITDGESALQNALTEAFPNAVSLMCITHIERNIRRHAKENLHLSDRFAATVIKDITGSVNNKGLIHSKTYNEYCSNVEKLHTKWNTMEEAEIPNREPMFFQYFRKNKAQVLYDHCMTHLSNDLGLVSEVADNNAPESLHATLRKWTDGNKNTIPNFIEELKALKDAQHQDIQQTFLSGKTPFIIRQEYNMYQVSLDELCRPSSELSNTTQKKISVIEEVSKKVPIKPIATEPVEATLSNPGPSSLNQVVDNVEQGECTINVASLSAILHLTLSQKETLVKRVKYLKYRDGFDTESLIFESKTKGQFYITKENRATYTCKCPTFVAYKICEHVIVHAKKSGKFKQFIQSISHKRSDPDSIANINGAESAGRKPDAKRVRKGRSDDQSRPNLSNKLSETPPTREYSVQQTGDLKMHIRPADNFVRRVADKPPCPPTLGEPFIVKPVSGNIKVCFGCKGTLKKPDMCVSHKQRSIFFNRQTNAWSETVGNKHFHINAECIKAGNNPDFTEDMLQNVL